ncbi:MAG TPA: deoxyribose-phosphate aldolase [Clostridiales bacterium]|nr:deoxyribose-phosphate aldolase [Clostridiales bacterium]
MTPKEIFSKVDHTLLSVTATKEELISLAEEAIRAGAASICVPPAAVSFLKQKYVDKVRITTVIGFPNGYNTTAAKVFETEDAVKNGADEVDMVVNVGKVKEKDYDYVLNEIKALRAASKGKILKVIVETCLLTEEEKIALCKTVTEAKADYIKTSTGFSKAGAQLEDVVLFKKHIGAGVKIKAAGGIRTLEDAEKFIAAGADRIGASAVIKGYLK